MAETSLGWFVQTLPEERGKLKDLQNSLEAKLKRTETASANVRATATLAVVKMDDSSGALLVCVKKPVSKPSMVKNIRNWCGVELLNSLKWWGISIQVVDCSSAALMLACSSAPVLDCYMDLPAHLSEVENPSCAATAKAIINQHGFVLLRGYVPLFFTKPVVDDVFAWVRWVLSQFKSPVRVPPESEDFRALVSEIPEAWFIWSGRGEPHTNWKNHGWAFQKQQGFRRDMGGGKMFRHSDFLNLSSLQNCQEFMRVYIASLYDAEPASLNFKPEGVSLKVPGSPRFGNHLDLNDEGRFQCAIALTNGAFTVVPRSNAVDVKEWQLLNNFYVPAGELCKHGLASLDLRCCRGDVMIWVGGRTVHGSPPVAPDGCNRVFTYAQFWPPKKSGKRLLGVNEAISRQSVS
jgi:hypothetical protein